MFSTSPTRPTTSTFALRPASAAMAPITAPAPAMSHFMSSMPPAGLMEMPPVSKVTPLPTKASGLDLAPPFLPLPLPRAPFQRITTMRGSAALPSETPISMPKPSLVISFGPKTSTFRPSFSSARQRSAISAGNSTLGGSLARSRARNTPSATAAIGSHAVAPPAGSAQRMESPASFGLSSAFSLVR